MADKHLASFCLVMLLKLVITSANSPNTLKEDCIGDSGFELQISIYNDSCPEAEAIIFSWVESAVMEDSRMAASLLRLHFHDCFVNACLQGCDASVLLDDTENFVGEKTAPPNLNSLRGFEVIDAIKSDLESVCPETVSCADILAISARDSVVLSGGPTWGVLMGRRDSFSASKAAATSNIPAPNSTLSNLVANFENVGLTHRDLVALSGAHTIGKARCSTFSSRIQSTSNTNGPDINPNFLQNLQQLCSESSSSSSSNVNPLAQLDLVTPATFDNQYYINLLSGEGLLPSDQVLASEDQTREIIESYAQDPSMFFEDFKTSMLKMGSLLGPAVLGDQGEIRHNCRAIN